MIIKPETCTGNCSNLAPETRKDANGSYEWYCIHEDVCAKYKAEIDRLKQQLDQAVKTTEEIQNIIRCGNHLCDYCLYKGDCHKGFENEEIISCSSFQYNGQGCEDE